MNRRTAALAENPPSDLGFAWEALRQGRPMTAAQAAVTVVAAESERAEAWRLLGLAFVALGQDDQACAALEQATALAPAAASALQLGLLHRRRDRWSKAAYWYRRAIALDPAFAPAFFNLGNLHRVQGDRAAAIRCWRNAVAADVAYAQAWVSLGRALGEAGDWEQAADALGRACACLRPDAPNDAPADAPDHAPDYAMASLWLGQALLALERFDGAAVAFTEALSRQGRLAAAHAGLARCHIAEERWSEAEAAARAALALEPNEVEISHHLAIALIELGRHEEARSLMEAALTQAPDSAFPPYCLGNLCHRQGDLAAAIDWYRTALALDADMIMAINNLANAVKELAERRSPADDGALAEAETLYRAAKEKTPDSRRFHAEIAFNLALTQLLRGNFAEGWRNYEERWHKRNLAQRLMGAAEWLGEPLEGRRLLVHWEQGFGDTLQFVRLCRMARERGGSVILVCQPALTSVLARTPGIDQLVSLDEPIPPFDLRVPLLSLPATLGLRWEDLPGPIPYVKAPPAAVARWREILGRTETENGEQRLKVGFVWQGNPDHTRDAWRSIPLSAMAPLARAPGVRLYSLQKGRHAAELESVRDSWGVTDLGPSLASFAQTAAAIQSLDLIIACDTSIVHLAGAMGIPVWCLVSHSPDWRWLHGRDDSPWYPSLRLFRQRWPESWEDVVERVAEALRARVDTPVAICQSKGG